MNTNSKKIASLALAGIMAIGMLGVAQSASAAPTPGTVTISPTSGTSLDDPFLQRLQVSTSCPTGFRASSGTFVIQGGLRSSIADARTPSTPTTDGSTGLDGAPIDLNRIINPINAGVSNKTLESISNPLVTGDWELRVQCFASATAPDFANDPWFALPMSFDAATGAWAVKGAGPVLATTTTSLTAGLNTGNTVTLSATVKKGDGSTATDAVGNVVFSEGATVVGTSAVASGLASFTTPAVTAGNHTYTATFTDSQATPVYAASTSGPASVTAPQEGAYQTGTANVTVTVPTATGTVSFTGLQANIPLGIAVYANGKFTASGNLGPIVVTDTRQLGAAPWALTGITSDFTAAGGKVILAKYLGWAPALVGTTNAGTAAGTIAPAVGTGLSVTSPLAGGSVVDGIQTTTVGAALNLEAPGTTAGGDYTSLLTLTLI